jgi:hypothetical protein
VRTGEIADQRACAFDRSSAWPPQQHAEPIAALRQLAQQMLADEAGGAGQRDEGLV